MFGLWAKGFRSVFSTRAFELLQLRTDHSSSNPVMTTPKRRIPSTKCTPPLNPETLRKSAPQVWKMLHQLRTLKEGLEER